MSDQANGLEFAFYAWQRRALVIRACLAALILTCIASFLLSKQYTATATILIEPPAGSDARTSVGLSQVYLESLKTYEQFASGDSLFLRALDQLNLRAQFADTSLETLKKRILTVSRPTNTTYIQISATLGTAADAQRLAQYIAQRAVETNGVLDQQTIEAMRQEPARIFALAKARRESADRAAAELAKNKSLEALKREYASNGELLTVVGRDLTSTRANLANYMGQLQAPLPIGTSNEVGGVANGDVALSWTHYEISATKARADDLQHQEDKLLAYLKDEGSALEELQRKRDSMDAELKSARADEDAARAKLSAIDIEAPFRGAKLKMLDPGIVPQRPSFPNIPLNLVVAFIGSIVLSLGYLAIRFAHDRVRESMGQFSWR